MNVVSLQALIHLKQVLMVPLTQLHLIPFYLIIQGAIFISVWILMNTFFFKPFARVYEKRNSKTVRALQESQTLNKESEDLESELRRKIEESTAAANRTRLTYIAEAKNKRDEMIQKANGEIQEHIKTMIAQIEKEKADLLAKLEADVRQFVPILSKKMMLK